MCTYVVVAHCVGDMVGYLFENDGHGPVREALLLSDLHLGWAVCADAHEDLVDHLDEAVDGAELIVLNGDIVDAVRGLLRARDRRLVARFAETVARWRKEGRRVVVVEGNHDPQPGDNAVDDGLLPTTWLFDFTGAHGERVRVLHGHKFSDSPFEPGAYETFGGHVLAAENKVYAHSTGARERYALGPGWVVGAIGLCEDLLWRWALPGRVGTLIEHCDALVHGHFHFGPGRGVIDGVPVYKSGAWASRGHLGSVDRMLRYRRGRFERLELTKRGFVVADDGR